MKPTGIVRDSTHPGMFRLLWEDGVLSADMYNLSRAYDILRNYDAYRDRMVMGGRPQNRRFADLRRGAHASNRIQAIQVAKMSP
jgi:hypothetical protein